MSDTNNSNRSVGQAYVAAARNRLAASHRRIVHAVGQLDDAQLWWRPREPLNSVANLLLHLCGNLRQWLVAGVGGAADVRNRPQEFAERNLIPKDELLRRLAAVVAEADAALAKIDEVQLLEKRRIQNFEGTVLAAIFDCLSHMNGHAQEIIFLTRLQVGDAYQFLWVPATVEQGARPENGAAREASTATDAVFEEMPTHPLASQTPAGHNLVPSVQAIPPELPPSVPGPDTHHQSPLKDYLLDLEQEFQDDEERGKL